MFWVEGCGVEQERSENAGRCAQYAHMTIYTLTYTKERAYAQDEWLSKRRCGVETALPACAFDTADTQRWGRYTAKEDSSAKAKTGFASRTAPTP
eukprot:scaffold2078_cov181-Pinguiococcus_pyrenoidosus.AAC.4